MKERIFNLYYLVEAGIIRGRAMVEHETDGTDDEKLNYLQMLCTLDYGRAKRYPVPSGWVYIDARGRKSPGMSWDTYQEKLSPIYGDIRWFEDIFQEVGAPSEPLVLITPVVDGAVRIDGERPVR